MGRSGREGPGRRIRGGEGQLPPTGRAPAFLPRSDSNATFRMQRRARPVCSGSRGPGAGNQLASVSEIRACGGGGGRWTNTGRQPQSPVLDSARGGAGLAVTLPLAAGRRGGAGWGLGEPGPPPPPTGTSAPRPGEAWQPGPPAGGGRSEETGTRRRSKAFLNSSRVRNFAPFP